MEENIVAQASYVECNHGGIEISLTNTNDALYWRRNWGEDSITEWKEAEIEHSTIDNDGSPFLDDEGKEEAMPYFRLDDGGWKYFLNEFMLIQL